MPNKSTARSRANNAMVEHFAERMETKAALTSDAMSQESLSQPGPHSSSAQSSSSQQTVPCSLSLSESRNPAGAGLSRKGKEMQACILGYIGAYNDEHPGRDLGSAVKFIYTKEEKQYYGVSSRSEEWFTLCLPCQAKYRSGNKGNTKKDGILTDKRATNIRDHIKKCKHIEDHYTMEKPVDSPRIHTFGATMALFSWPAKQFADMLCDLAERGLLKTKSPPSRFTLQEMANSYLADSKEAIKGVGARRLNDDVLGERGNTTHHVFGQQRHTSYLLPDAPEARTLSATVLPNAKRGRSPAEIEE